MQLMDRIRYCTDPIEAKQNPAEYWERISAEMNALYAISFLLTADKERAELCLDETLDDFVEGSEDFVEWARTRGRDAVMEHATVMMKPGPDASEDEMDFSDGLFFSSGDHLLGVIAGLPPFERFVFAMTTIYGKSDTECARLLGAARCEVTIARELIELILATNGNEESPASSKHSARCDGAYLFSSHCSNC